MSFDFSLTHLSSPQVYTFLVTALLFSWLTLLQSRDYIVQFQNEAQHIWNYKNLNHEWQIYFHLSDKFLQKILSASFIISSQKIRVLVGVLILFLSLINIYEVISTGQLLEFSFFIYGLLIITSFILHLFMCLIFRGTTNGGSDMMTVVVATGLLLFCFLPANLQHLGLIYIAIHTFWSYFKAGWVKLVNSEWLKGEALPLFFARKILKKNYFNLQAASLLVFQMLSLLVIIYEISFVSLLRWPQLVIYYFVASMLFHLFNYFYFGLNRFVWAWLSAWPALIYTMFLIK